VTLPTTPERSRSMPRSAKKARSAASNAAARSPSWARVRTEVLWRNAMYSSTDARTALARCSSPSIVKTGRLHGRDCVGRFRVMGESDVAVGYRQYRLAVRPVDVLIVDDCQVCAGCEGLTKARQNEAGIHPMEAGATYDQP